MVWFCFMITLMVLVMSLLASYFVSVLTCARQTLRAAGICQHHLHRKKLPASFYFCADECQGGILLLSFP